jgi:hypothetical protein
MEGFESFVGGFAMRLQATTMAFAMQNPLLTLAETAMVCE